MTPFRFPTLAAIVALFAVAGGSAARADPGIPVTVKNDKSNPVPVTVSNLPAVQSVQVTNFPTSAPASSVTVSNLPAVQQIAGTVTPVLNPYGLFNQQIVIPNGTQFVFGGTGAHSVMTWVNASATVQHGQPVMAEMLVNTAGGIFFDIPMTFVRVDVTSGLDVYVGQSTFPLYIPANTGITFTFAHDITANGFFQGGFTLTGINLD
jgi:hypothetical protein